MGNSRIISRVVSLGEVVVDTVSEQWGVDRGIIENLFNQSLCKRSLYDINSDYYRHDIEKIIKDFKEEIDGE